MRRILVQALSENMYEPAVGMNMSTGTDIPLSELAGIKFTGYFMTNPALVRTLQDLGIDAKMTKIDEETGKLEEVFVQDPGDEVYVIRSAKRGYVWQYKDLERLPEDFVIRCRKYVIKRDSSGKQIFSLFNLFKNEVKK